MNSFKYILLALILGLVHPAYSQSLTGDSPLDSGVTNPGENQGVMESLDLDGLLPSLLDYREAAKQAVSEAARRELKATYREQLIVYFEELRDLRRELRLELRLGGQGDRRGGG